MVSDFVLLCVCVCVSFLKFWFMGFLFCFFFLLVYLFVFQRKRKGLVLRGREDLGGGKGEEAMIRIYCMKCFPSINQIEPSGEGKKDN